MIDFISYITEALIKNATISSKDRELYSYGLNQGLQMILNFITSIMIGLSFGMFLESLIFMIVYIPLRSYAGGYHAKTHIKCYISSIVILSAALLGIKLLPLTSFICMIITICAGGVIVFLAPEGDKNKPLDQTEIVIFKNRTRKIFLIDVFMMIIFGFFKLYQLSTCIVMVFIVISILLFMSKIRKFIQGESFYDEI